MCDLDSFHLLTVDGQMRVLEQMLADRRDDERARAERYARTFSPLVTTPVLPPAAKPLERVVASPPSPMEKPQ